MVVEGGGGWLTGKKLKLWCRERIEKEGRVKIENCIKNRAENFIFLPICFNTDQYLLFLEESRSENITHSDLAT